MEANKNKGKSILNVQTVGKEKKGIFLCARFPPCGEAGDIRIWGGGALQGLLSNLSSPIF
jgi:hypothetical protein